MQIRQLQFTPAATSISGPEEELLLKASSSSNTTSSSSSARASSSHLVTSSTFSSSSSSMLSMMSSPSATCQLDFELAIEGEGKSKFASIMHDEHKVLDFLGKHHPVFGQMGLTSSMITVREGCNPMIAIQGKGPIAGLCRLLVKGSENPLFQAKEDVVGAAESILNKLGRTPERYKVFATNTPHYELGAHSAGIQSGKNQAKEVLIDGKPHIVIERPLGRAISDDMAAISCLMRRLNGVTPKGRVLYDKWGNRTGFATEKVPHSITLNKYLHSLDPIRRKRYLLNNAKQLGRCVAHLLCIMQDDFHLDNILVNEETGEIIPIDFDRANFPSTAKYSTFKDDNIAALFPPITSRDIRSPINPINMKPNNWFTLNHDYFHEGTTLRSFVISRLLPGLDEVVQTSPFQQAYYDGFTEFASLTKDDFEESFSAVRSKKRRDKMVDTFTQRALKLRSTLLIMPEYHQYLKRQGAAVSFVTKEAVDAALEEKVKKLISGSKWAKKHLRKIKKSSGDGPELQSAMIRYSTFWRKILSECETIDALKELLKTQGKRDLIPGVEKAHKKMKFVSDSLLEHFQQPLEVMHKNLGNHMRRMPELKGLRSCSEYPDYEYISEKLLSLESFKRDNHQELLVLDYISDPIIKDYVKLREELLQDCLTVLYARQWFIMDRLKYLQSLTHFDSPKGVLMEFWGLVREYNHIINIYRDLIRTDLIDHEEYYNYKASMKENIVVPMAKVFSRLNQQVVPTFDKNGVAFTLELEWIEKLEAMHPELPFTQINRTKRTRRPTEESSSSSASASASASASSASSQACSLKNIFSEDNLPMTELAIELKANKMERLRILEEKLQLYQRYLEMRKSLWAVFFQLSEAKMDDAVVPTHVSKQWQVLQDFHSGKLTASKAWKKIYKLGHEAYSRPTSSMTRFIGYTSEAQQQHYDAFKASDDDSALIAHLRKVIPPVPQPSPMTMPTGSCSPLASPSHPAPHQ